MTPALLIITLFATAMLVYWACELVRVASLPDELFESHMHRLTWFLIVFVTGIIGAVWFRTWSKQRAIVVNATDKKQSWRQFTKQVEQSA